MDGRRRAALRAEAAESVRRMPARAWLLFGYDGATSSILKEEMDRRLVLRREFDLSGPYYTHVLEYARF